MKKIFKLIILVFSLFFLISQQVNWEWGWGWGWWAGWWSSWWWGGGSNMISVKVSEKIPWAACSKDGKWYKCSIAPWMNTVQLVIGQIIKWFTAIAALAWVLFIVINWILLSMHWWEKEKIKWRIKDWITWLILLLLSWVILSIIAPWVYK